MGKNTEGSKDDLRNISLEEHGETSKSIMFLVMFFCFFVIFFVVGGLFKLQVTSEVFIFASIVTSLILAAFIYTR